MSASPESGRDDRNRRNDANGNDKISRADRLKKLQEELNTLESGTEAQKNRILRKDFPGEQEQGMRSRRTGEGERRPWTPRENNDRPRNDRDNNERRPWTPREGNDRPRNDRDNNERRPWTPRESNDRPRYDRDNNERRPWTPREGNDRPRNDRDNNERRPWTPREGNDRPRNDRDNNERRPWTPREGNDRPRNDRDNNERRPWTPREGNDRPRNDRDNNERRPWIQREGNDRPRYNRDNNERRPWTPRDGNDRPRYDRDNNERRPWTPRESNDRPRYDRDSNERRPWTPRESNDRPRYDRDSNERRPWTPREGNDRDQRSDRRFPKDRPKKIDTRRKNRGDEPMKPVTINFDEPIRLNRFIANAGVCSRRRADELIANGSITVNDKVVTELGSRVNPGDTVVYNGKTLKLETLVYVLLNKPKDFITTLDDPEDRRTVMSLVEKATDERIFPVGRLDRNTTGLLLLTNDGELAQKLTHPSNEVGKVYDVVLNKPLTKADYERIAAGVELEDGMAYVDAIAFPNPEDKTEVGLEIHSGRNRIVRRIFEALGYDVVKLDRVLYAGLTKKDLSRGHWRYLSEKEIRSLKTI